MAEQAELTRTGHQNRLQTINPATAEPGRSYEAHNLDDAHRAAAAARKAFLDWRRTSFGERAAIVRKAAGILRNVRTVIRSDGRLLVIEFVLPDLLVQIIEQLAGENQRQISFIK